MDTQPLATAPAMGTAQLFGTFHLGDFELALPIGALQEVVPFPPAITQVPLAPLTCWACSTCAAC